MSDKEFGIAVIAATTSLGAAMAFFLPSDKLTTFLPFLGPIIGIGISKIED
jgi:hypothetical protein